jgi:hypothetical protein
VHRLLRAEKRFIRCKKAFFAEINAPPEVFVKSEKRISRVRKMLIDTSRSLASLNYTLEKFSKKSEMAKVVLMTAEDYDAWKNHIRQETNNDIAAVS